MAFIEFFISHLTYIHSVKSNDEKRALTMDMSRVQHQVKYLGLSENIKVRRAGFAYRNDFHRFLDRFAILSSATYPEWQGSDKVSAMMRRVGGSILGG